MEMHVYFFLNENDEFHTCQAIYKGDDYSSEVLNKDKTQMNVGATLYSKMHHRERKFFDQNFKQGSYMVLRHSYKNGINKYDVTPNIE